MRDDLAELIDTQNTIIKMQSEVINEALRLLLQYMTAEEVDNLPLVDKINRIAKL